MSIFTDLKTRLAQRRRYLHTLNELNRMRQNDAWDLGLDPHEFPQLARASVYGS